MAKDEDVKIVFRAADEFSAVLQKANAALGGITASSSRVEKELYKLSSASEFAAGGLRRIRSTLEGMAFGVVVGAVSAVTQEFINAWQRAFNAEEIMNKLNSTILNQAGSWKILPVPMQAVAQSTVDIYNAQLKLSQFYAVSEVPKLKREIEDLQKANEMAGAEIYRNAQLFGPYNAGLFNAAALNKKNQETILQNNVTLAEKRDKLRQLLEVQELQSTSLEKVNVATGKQTELVADSVLQDRNWLTLNLAYMEYLKTEEENFRQRLLKTPLDIYWLPSDEEISHKTKKMEEARQKLKSMDRQAMTGPGAPEQLQEAVQMNERRKALKKYYDEQKKLGEDASATQIEFDMQTAALKLSIAQGSMAMMSNMAQNMYALTGSKNKEMFTVMKAFAVAETTIQTYRAAQGAYAALASIPYVGPALAVAAAAAAIVAGMARVKQIQSMQPGGASGTIGAGGEASPSYYGGSPSAYAPTALTGREQQTQPVTINLTVVNPLSDENWAKITEEQIVPYLEQYTSRGGTVNLNIA